MTDDRSPEEQQNDGYAKVHLGKTPRELAAMGDSELDIWQSRHSPGSHQFSRAEREWQRRLVVEQLKTARFSAWLGAIATIIGSVLAFVLRLYVGTSNQSERLGNPVAHPTTTCSCTQNISPPLATKNEKQATDDPAKKSNP
jgi:hypothetical protein